MGYRSFVVFRPVRSPTHVPTEQQALYPYSTHRRSARGSFVSELGNLSTSRFALAMGRKRQEGLSRKAANEAALWGVEPAPLSFDPPLAAQPNGLPLGMTPPAPMVASPYEGAFDAIEMGDYAPRPKINPQVAGIGLTDAIAVASQKREAETIRLRAALGGRTNAQLLEEQDLIQRQLPQEIAQQEGRSPYQVAPNAGAMQGSSPLGGPVPFPGMTGYGGGPDVLGNQTGPYNDPSAGNPFVGVNLPSQPPVNDPSQMARLHGDPGVSEPQGTVMPRASTEPTTTQAPILRAMQPTSPGDAPVTDPRAVIQKRMSELANGYEPDDRDYRRAVSEYRQLMAPHIPALQDPRMSDGQAIGQLLAMAFFPQQAAQIAAASYKALQANTDRTNGRNQWQYEQELQRFRYDEQNARQGVQDARADMRDDERRYDRSAGIEMQGLNAQLSDIDREEAADRLNLDRDVEHLNDAMIKLGGPSVDPQAYEAAMQKIERSHRQPMGSLPRLPIVGTPQAANLTSQIGTREADLKRKQDKDATDKMLKDTTAAVRAWETQVRQTLATGGVRSIEQQAQLDSARFTLAQSYGINANRLAKLRVGMTSSQFSAETARALGQQGIVIRQGQLQVSQQNADTNSYRAQEGVRQGDERIGISQQNADTSLGRADGTHSGGTGTSGNTPEQKAAYGRKAKAKESLDALNQDYVQAESIMNDLSVPEATRKKAAAAIKALDDQRIEIYRQMQEADDEITGGAVTGFSAEPGWAGVPNIKPIRNGNPPPANGGTAPPAAATVKRIAAKTTSAKGPSCANYACQIGNNLYQGFPKTDSAGGLVKALRTKGAKEIPRAQARAGDMVYYYGPQYGTLKDSGGNGWHVGWVVGDGPNAEVRDSSGNIDNRARKLGAASRILRLPDGMRKPLPNTRTASTPTPPRAVAPKPPKNVSRPAGRTSSGNPYKVTK